MSIDYSSATRTFFLHSGETTYALKVLAQGFLTHLYWGPRVSAQELDFVLQFRERAFSPNPDGLGREFSLDTLPLEYPVYGNTDFRSPALEVFHPRTDHALWICDSRIIGPWPASLPFQDFPPLGSNVKAKPKR